MFCIYTHALHHAPYRLLALLCMQARRLAFLVLSNVGSRNMQPNKQLRVWSNMLSPISQTIQKVTSLDLRGLADETSQNKQTNYSNDIAGRSERGGAFSAISET